MPYNKANAGFWSSLIGNDASADNTIDTANSAQPDKSSQNMPLLQSNISATSVIQDQKDKDTKKSDTANSDIKQDANVNTSGNALVPATTGHVSSTDADNGDLFSDQVSVYVVRDGDSINDIAKMFDVSAKYILWTNGLKKGDKLIKDQILVILPVSGIEHTVEKGQTIKNIAKLYKVDVDEITSYNGINEDSKLAIGDTLIIPNADISDEGGDVPSNKSKSKTKIKGTQKYQKYYSTHPLKDIANFFINPVPGARRSQGFHDNNAVDLAIAKGTPIHAAASGKVVFAAMGWNGAFGGLVLINHDNGVQTLYAHQSRIVAHAGDRVSQGEIIGYVGSTGHSTGPHLHFEVHGAHNPGTDGTWAN